MLVHFSPVTAEDTPDIITASQALSQADGASFAVLPADEATTGLQLEIDDALRRRKAGERFLVREGGADGQVIGGAEVTDSPTGPEVGGWIHPQATHGRSCD